MSISLEKLNSAFADATEEDVTLYFEAFNQACLDYEINTPERMAAFIAQVAHESGQLTAVKENLNYSADGLMRIFKKYFTPALAAQYARKPEKIASRVYANRMGNGPEESGDGWKYRGRGLIQLTGKDNYTKFAADMEMTLDEAVEYLETPEGAMESAACINPWLKNVLSKMPAIRYGANCWPEGNFEAKTKEKTYQSTALVSTGLSKVQPMPITLRL